MFCVFNGCSELQQSIGIPLDPLLGEFFEKIQPNREDQDSLITFHGEWDSACSSKYHRR